MRKHAGTSNSSSTQREQSALRVFVTLDMPAASLKGLADQAARSGAVLVLRGLKNNSMRTTLTALQALIGERQVAWQIDPEAFKHFRVERAPTFVLLTGGSGSFAAVAGDVSLDYALHAMERQVPASKPHAQPFLTRLKDSR